MTTIPMLSKIKNDLRLYQYATIDLTSKLNVGGKHIISVRSNTKA